MRDAKEVPKVQKTRLLREVRDGKSCSGQRGLEFRGGRKRKSKLRGTHRNGKDGRLTWNSVHSTEGKCGVPLGGTKGKGKAYKSNRLGATALTEIQ